MTIEIIISELDKIKRVFREVILTSNFLKNDNQTITWPNYIPGIHRGLYAKEYETLVSRRQYSFLLSEKKGFIQFYYYFDEDKKLHISRMGYYPSPIMLENQEQDLDSYLHDSDDVNLQEYYYYLLNLIKMDLNLSFDEQLTNKLIDVFTEHEIPVNENSLLEYKFLKKYSLTNTTHIRIDFDAKVETHHKYEIQIGGIKQIRIPMNTNISPFVFFDFIVKNIFPQQYSVISSKSGYEADFNNSNRYSILEEGFEEKNIFTTVIN